MRGKYHSEYEITQSRLCVLVYHEVTRIFLIDSKEIKILSSTCLAKRDGELLAK